LLVFRSREVPAGRINLLFAGSRTSTADRRFLNQARKAVFSIRLIFADWKVPLAVWARFFSPRTRREGRVVNRNEAHGRGSRASRFLSTTWKRNEQKSCPRDQSETAPRTHACHDAAHLRVRGPRAHRAGGAHQPQRQLRHGRRGGASACQPSDSLGNDSARRVARRLASRRATCPERRARPRRHALRGRGRDPLADDRHPRPGAVPCRPPAADARRAKRPTASVFFSASDQISSLPASPAPSPAPGLARLRARPPRRDCPLAFVSRRVSFPSFPRSRRPCPR